MKQLRGFLVMAVLLAAGPAALNGCGLAGTAVGTAAGAAGEAQQARQAKQLEQQVRNRVQAAQRQAAAQRDQAERDAQ